MNGDQGMDDVFVFDLDYEFDADTFFDFTQPESVSEAHLSENWFHSATSCPPSPFIVKLKWKEEMYGEIAKASFKTKSGESIKNLDRHMNPYIPELNGNRKGPICNDELSPSKPNTKTKSVGKPSEIRVSTLMKPTASRLAKLKPPNEISHSRSIGRSPSSLTGLSERSSKSSVFSVYHDATKRQKLDIGYLLKVAHLKHKNMLLHKLTDIPRVVGNVNSRPKPTIPREPDLETAHRAQRHRSRNNPETDVNTKLKQSVSQAQPVSKKILKTSPLSRQKKGEQQSSNNQKPNIRISKSISTDETDTERLNDENAPNQEKSEPADRTKVRPLSKQKLKNPVENKSSCNPPTELFKKLSLKSEVEHGATCRSKQQLKNKVPKENVPSFFRREILDGR